MPFFGVFRAVSGGLAAVLREEISPELVARAAKHFHKKG
jgi:hypothetical protein